MSEDVTQEDEPLASKCNQIPTIIETTIPEIGLETIAESGISLTESDSIQTNEPLEMSTKPMIIATEVKNPTSTEKPVSNGIHSSMEDIPKNRKLKDSTLAKLPSVKNLVNLFSKENHQSKQIQPNHNSNASNGIHNQRATMLKVNGLTNVPTQVRTNNYKVILDF